MSADKQKVFTDLNLNGTSPARVQPRIGEWGPAGVPSTRQKKWMRLWVSLAFIGIVTALFLWGWWVWKQMGG